MIGQRREKKVSGKESEKKIARAGAECVCGILLCEY